jgi:hypothetical protein
MRRFTNTVLAYGLARGIYYSTQLEHSETHERMPIGTASAFVIGTAGMSFLAFPAYLVHDVNYIDRRFFMHNLNKVSHRTTFPSPGEYLLPRVGGSPGSSS